MTFDELVVKMKTSKLYYRAAANSQLSYRLPLVESLGVPMWFMASRHTQFITNNVPSV